MSYRKLRGDHIFTGSQLLDKDHVLITGNKGKIEAIVPLAEAGDDIYTVKGVLTPGFINCHCHLELSHMKGAIPEKTGMVDFLLSVLGKRNYPVEQIQSAIVDAEQSMLENGIVAIGDICNTTDTLDKKKNTQLYYHNFIESTGFVPATASQRFEFSLNIFERFAALYPIPAASNSIAPHAGYSVSPELFHSITGFPGNQILTIHNQESLAEDEFFKKGTGPMLRLYQSLGIDISFYKPGGKSSLQTYLPWFLPNQTLILVHNVTTSVEDLLTTHHFPSLFFCLCPNANLYIGNGLPDIDLFRRYKESIVIGTDSLASNHVLSIATELATIHRHFPHIEISELLQWATLNGAKALGLDHLLGSFEPGKTPGVLVIKEDFSEVERMI